MIAYSAEFGGKHLEECTLPNNLPETWRNSPPGSTSEYFATECSNASRMNIPLMVIVSTVLPNGITVVMSPTVISPVENMTKRGQMLSYKNAGKPLSKLL